MKKQDVIPVAALRDLWETGEVHSAEEYAKKMNSVGLCSQYAVRCEDEECMGTSS